ncbi:cysteine dioxygenase family protein [Leptolyngbya iicbica]|uniref:Cupin n=2 Tax=Cyanophyceae TaxID=3028117 RepID=A0A4V2E1U7_9CYAN|nr:cupin [Leptolyngbya sp. LK]RZM75357.1 cupin [Leptolyngbya sp. LK]
MENANWLLTEDGQLRQFGSAEIELPQKVYRLYHFLSDLDLVLENYQDDVSRIEAIVPLVRKLLLSSYWLQLEYDPPSPKTGWAVKFLYREYQYPLTVQMVTWQPGTPSTIHNHGTWGIVALLGGQERNRFWQRAADSDSPHRIEPTGELLLNPGDVIGFTSGAIHAIESLGDENAVSFNLYGVTDRDRRYKFDPDRQTAEKF